MQKLFIIFGDDANERNNELFNEKKLENFKFLPLDAPAYEFIQQKQLPLVIIDEWINNKYLIEARIQATKWEDDWYKYFEDSFTSNGICWPMFDKEAMYWFWRDYAFANLFGEKFLALGGKELNLFVNSTLRPAIYYYRSDIHVAVFKEIFSGNFNLLRLYKRKFDKTNTESLFCPAISFEVNNNCENITASSIITGKIVFALNPGEFHRFKPLIIRLSKEFPKQIVIMSIFPENGATRLFSKEYSIPIVTPLHNKSINLNLGTKFFNKFEEKIRSTNEQLLNRLASQASYHFEYYLKYRWPILNHNYLSWLKLFEKNRPIVLITSQLSDSEAQLPAVAASDQKIPTLSLPHGGFGGRKGEFAKSKYILFNSTIQKKVLEKSGIPQKHLQPCREILDENEYPTRGYDRTQKAPLRQILIITYPISINQFCPTICPKSQIKALKDLNNPPEDIAKRIELTIKPHPGWPELELFSAISSNLKEKVCSSNQNLNGLMKSTDLVIALNCSATAITHVLRAGKPVVFFWTDPLIKYGVDPNIFADLLLPGGVLIKSSIDLWETIRRFLTDSEFSNNLRQKAKNFAKEKLDESNYPDITEVIKSEVLNGPLPEKESKNSIRPQINNCAIDQIIKNYDTINISLIGDQFDYGEMPDNELEVLCKIVRYNDPKTIFEIGTFLGRTTLQLAANSGAQIYTLDLPPNDLGGQSNRVVGDPELDVYPEKAGIKFQNTSFAERIRQYYGNSQNFDFSPFYGQVDCVFVDANHHYEFVLRDSMNAFKMINPAGVIIWHDYAPYAPGVIRALNLVNQKFLLHYIEGTSLVVYMGARVDHTQKMEKKLPPKLSVQNYSNDAKLLYAKAEQMIKSGNTNAAKRTLLKIFENFPDDAIALANLAEIEYKERNFQSANEFIKSALIVDPSNDHARSLLKKN
jgi:hypothetical protein